MYEANTLRKEAASEIFRTYGNNYTTVWNLEFKCHCVYSLKAQISAGILTESGALGAATQAEVQQQFTICLSVIAAKGETAPEKYLSNTLRNQVYYWEIEVESPDSGVIVHVCSNDARSYGDTMQAADVPGQEYVLLLSTDQRSLPMKTSFRANLRIMPSNHANLSMSNESGVDFSQLPLPYTGLVRENCENLEAWGAVADKNKAYCETPGLKSGATGAPCFGYYGIIKRTNLNSDVNNNNAAFALNLPSTAWLGYSYNIFYAQTTRCTINGSVGGTQDYHCAQCQADKSQNSGTPVFLDGLLTTRRRLAAKGQDAQGGNKMQVALHMVTPKYVLDTSDTPFAQGARIESFDSAAVLALAGLAAMLF